MRRIQAVAFIALASCVTFSVASAAPWHYGVRAGGGMTNIHGDFPDIADPKYQNSFTGGAFTEYEVAPSVTLGLEALYVSKGAKFEGTATDPQGNPTGTSTAHLRLKYLEVPLLARVSLPQMGTVRPYLVAGPSAGFALGATSEIDNGEKADLGDDLQSPDLGVLGGLGIRFPMGSLSAGVEARYSTGFNDLWDISNTLESINDGYSLTFSLGR
jgi:hypothetical protein